MTNPVPDSRILRLSNSPLRSDGEFVLYWMIGQRRLRWNFALDRAVEHARELGRPLVILEALRIDYPWAAPRHHRFVLDGMAEHRAAAADAPVFYFPYVEPEVGAGKGLLAALGEKACVVVTDDMPYFFYPKMLEAAARAIPVHLEAVDSHGILPVREAERGFTVAHSFRRHIQKTVSPHLGERPVADPLSGDDLPSPAPLLADDGPLSSILERWAPAGDDLLDAQGSGLAKLPLQGDVPPVPFPGGPGEARRRMEAFFDRKLARYPDERNDPDADVGSRLSPYLHWGHLSAHEIFHTVIDREGWSPARLAPKPNGKREGWWGMSAPAEAFLDELLTWREIGFNEWVRGGPEIETYESLPEWARTTLEEHAGDPRDPCYDLEAFDAADTHDPLWNAAQRELRQEGTIHNYLRMLWGKKILEWSAHPRDALEIMFELNNRYAVDGRDPNSTSGIMWVLGRYDRGWPERAVFGKVRSMSSDSTRRKVSVKAYLERYEA